MPINLCIEKLLGQTNGSPQFNFHSSMTFIVLNLHQKTECKAQQANQKTLQTNS